MFSIVPLLALSGVVDGMLNCFEHFSVPAWRRRPGTVMIAALRGLTPLFEGENCIYAYAIGALVGTVVQFDRRGPGCGGGAGTHAGLDWRNPHVPRVLKLMFPVMIALGVINEPADQLVPGTLVSDQAPAAIDKVFRIYQLPQGLFSISIATILFPTMSKLAARGATDDLRSTMANGVRQVALLLIPSAVLMAVLAEPITRLVYQRGEFDAEATELVKTAMVWWSISLPFQGISLLFSRTFFSLQQPWATTALAFVNMVVNGLVSLALYKPFGIAGIVIGTVVGTLVMTTAQGWLLRGQLGGIEGRKMLDSGMRMLAAAALLAGASYGVWDCSTRPWAGRCPPSWCPSARASAPAWPCTAPACGRCGCPRRARSGRCCPAGGASSRCRARGTPRARRASR